MADSWKVNSNHSKVAYLKYVEDMYAKHGHLTFSEPRIGADRSITQNGLLHVFATEYVAYRLDITKKQVTKGLLAGMKLIIKQRYTAAHPESYSWMVHDVVNPFNGKSKKDYTSSADWKRGEMFLVLTWLQMVAAEDGLILESRGEFAKAQRESNG